MTTPTSPSRPRARADGWALASIPGIVFLLAFFLLPLVVVLLRSFEDGGANYVKFFASSGYVQILLQTFQIAFLVTVTCLLIGYPYAYLMSRLRGTAQLIMLAIVLLPVWTSFLVRSVALQTWLQDTGVINSFLKLIGLIDQPLPLIRTTFGVVVGMTQILLPFLILPLFAVMSRVRPELVPAARSLGASPWAAFLRVYVPQTVTGILSGCLLVFVIALGFFIVPAILGGTEGSMISKLIVDLIGRNDSAMASTMAAILLIATLIVLGIGSRFVKITDVVGGGPR